MSAISSRPQPYSRATAPSLGLSKSRSAAGENSSAPTSGAVFGGSSLLHASHKRSRDSVLGESNEKNNAQSVEKDSSAAETATGSDNPNQMAESTKAMSAVETAIATDSAGLEAAKAAMENNLAEAASDPKSFHEIMKKSFGESYDKAKAETIRQQVLDGDFSWMPKIEVVDASVLQDQSGTQGAGEGLGAYSKDNDTIYISRQLLASDPHKAAQILTEEVGHGLDARLNTSDAAGDEGDIFARLVGGEDISDSELVVLKSENDSGTIIVDGKEVEVEYGFLSKAFKAVTKPFKKVANAIKDTVSDAWSGIKKGFKKVMQSKLFATILTIAQFIPIPIVQVVVRVANLVRAAYQVYQGVKHGSIAAVLGGVAGVAGGVGSLGKLAGASAGFVKTASSIATGARTAASAYQAISTGNFAAAAGLASNYFGGNTTDLGRAFNTAGQVVNTVQKAQDGDILGAIQSGRSAYSGFTSQPTSAEANSGNDVTGNNNAAPTQRSGIGGFIDSVKSNETYQAIVDNVSTIRDIVKSVKDGDYSAASAQFLGNYGEDLGIDADTQQSIQKWAGVVEKVSDTAEAIDDGNYASAIDQAAGLLGIPVSEKNQNRISTVFALRDSVLADNYSNASRQAASLALQSGNAPLASNFLRLANLLDGNIPLPQSQNSQAA